MSIFNDLEKIELEKRIEALEATLPDNELILHDLGRLQTRIDDLEKENTLLKASMLNMAAEMMDRLKDDYLNDTICDLPPDETPSLKAMKKKLGKS